MKPTQKLNLSLAELQLAINEYLNKRNINTPIETRFIITIGADKDEYNQVVDVPVFLGAEVVVELNEKEKN